MQGKNHVALALSIPLAAAMVAGQEALPPSVAGWGGLIVGALLPDMDGGGSVAYWGNWLPRPLTPAPLRAGLNGLGKTTSDVIRAIFGHRNALHWPVWGLALALAGTVTGQDWLLWLGVGYILHILGDSLTKSGVPLFGPISRKDISFSPMKTGGPAETLLGGALWAFVAWSLWHYLPPDAWLRQIVSHFGASAGIIVASGGKTMKVYNIKLSLELNPGPDQVYTVTSPDIPELFTEGSTLDEIQRNVQEAIRALVEVYRENGWELPPALRPEHSTPIEQLGAIPVAV